MAASDALFGEKDSAALGPFIRKDLMKLYNAVIGYSRHSASQKDTEKVKEVNQLLGYCSTQDNFEANSFSSLLLLKLCHAKIVSTDYLMKKFLTISAISKNLVCPVSSIFELIIMEIKEQIDTHGNYQCPYKIRSPPHPLITVFQQRQDSCDVIVSEMKHFFEVEKKEKRIVGHLLAALKPFLSFVFLDPKHSSKSWELFTVNSALIQLMRRMDEVEERYITIDIGKLLLRMIAFRKTTRALIYENISLTEQLAHCLLELPITDETADILLEIGYTVISQCHKLAQMGLRISVHLELMLKIFMKYPEGFISEEFVYLIALLLYRVSSVYKMNVLILAIHVLPCYIISCKSSSQFIVLKAFIFPLMIIISNNMGLKEEEDQQKLAQNTIMNIETHVGVSMDTAMTDKKDFQTSMKSQLEIITAKHHNFLLQEICRFKSSALEFIKGLRDAKSCSDSTLLVFSALVVNPDDSDVLKEALSLISELGKNDPEVGVQFLPVLLHASNRSTNSKIKFQILEFLPCLAANKHAVSPVLKAVTMLGNCTPLLPLSIRLTTNLWKIQPRTFPYLLQLLSKKPSASDVRTNVWDEITIARAASVFEVCKLRPTQYGPDVVGILSKLFNSFEEGSLGTSPEVAETAIYLGLEALKSLCEAEVSDFQTVWHVVSSQLSTQRTDLILKGMMSLLSITPLVLGNSTDDLNPNIVSFASTCLTHFSTEEFIVDKLPEKSRLHAVDLLTRKHNAKKRQEDDVYDPGNESINGAIYVYLLENLQSEAAEGFSVLLSKVLKEEVELLPRNISSASAAKKIGSKFDKYIESIPESLKSSYEKNGSPAIVPGIAAGILSCGKSTAQLGRKETIGRRHLIEDAKVNRKMLDSLLKEISVVHADWLHSITAPTSWMQFLSQVMESTIEGRKAELSLQFDQGKIPNEKELDVLVSASHYWARDELTIQLMRASRESPSMQGNSILALSGLALCMVNVNRLVDDKNKPLQYVATKDWLVKVADTVMVVFDGNFKPKGNPFQWCQQFSSHKSTASSLLSRACAAVALSEIAVALISVDLDRIEQIIHLLASRMPGQERAGTSSVIQFNAAIGLGMIVHRLQQEQFHEIMGKDGYDFTRKAFSVLEATAYNETVQNREGALFGYGMAFGWLCSENTKNSRDCASHAHETLIKRVQSCFNLAQKLKPIDEGYIFALTAATLNCFKAGICGTDSVLKCIDVLKVACGVQKQSLSLHAMYGCLLHGVFSMGFAQIKDLIDGNVDVWLVDIADSNKAFSERIAGIYGVLSVFGAISFLFPCDDLDVFDSAMKNKLTVAIKKIIALNEAPEFCMHSCRLLGLLHMVHREGASWQAALPSDYSYLPDSSLLRCLYKFLLDAGKSGPYGKLSTPAINAVLSTLANVTDTRLPPVSWPQAFNPLMKLNFGDGLQQLCLKLAIQIAPFCPSLPTWLLSWLSPSVFLSLELSSKKEVLDNFTTIVSMVPLNKVKSIVDELMVKMFQREVGCLEERILVLQALKKLASTPYPVQSSLVCIKDALTQICGDASILKSKIVIKGIAEVLMCLPAELRRSVLDSLQTTDHIICIESAMVIFFNSSLKCVDRTLQIASTDPASLSDLSMQSLNSALQFHYLNSSSPKDHDERVIWFLDQLERIKLFVSTEMIDKAHRWLEVVASATRVWSASGLSLAAFDNQANTSYRTASMELFGVHLNSLLEQSRWQNLREKIFSWLIELIENCGKNLDASTESFYLILKGILLRICQSALWTSEENWVKSMDILLNT